MGITICRAVDVDTSTTKVGKHVLQSRTRDQVVDGPQTILHIFIKYKAVYKYVSPAL